MVVLSEIRERVPPDYPVVAFLVTGIEDLVAGLTARGVAFLDAAPSSFAGMEGRISGGGKIVDYGPVKSTWLRDSEGNVLALNEIVG
jgi:hypothetical protein